MRGGVHPGAVPAAVPVLIEYWQFISGSCLATSRAVCTYSLYDSYSSTRVLEYSSTDNDNDNDNNTITLIVSCATLLFLQSLLSSPYAIIKNKKQHGPIACGSTVLQF